MLLLLTVVDPFLMAFHHGTLQLTPQLQTLLHNHCLGVFQSKRDARSVASPQFMLFFTDCLTSEIRLEFSCLL